MEYDEEIIFDVGFPLIDISKIEGIRFINKIKELPNNCQEIDLPISPQGSSYLCNNTLVVKTINNVYMYKLSSLSILKQLCCIKMKGLVINENMKMDFYGYYFVSGNVYGYIKNIVGHEIDVVGTYNTKGQFSVFDDIKNEFIVQVNRLSLVDEIDSLPEPLMNDNDISIIRKIVKLIE